MSAKSSIGFEKPDVKRRGTERAAVRRGSGVPTLTKRDLVLKIADSVDLPQDVVLGVVQQFLDGITEALSDGQHIEFRDFGVFEIALRRSRVGRNPNRPGNTVTIPERKVVKFKPGKRMKSLISQG